MINSNENLKKRRGNGTQCTGVAIKLKDDAAVSWKNWDGRRVRTVNVDDVEYITCELTNQLKEKSLFNLKSETDTVVITLQLYGKLHSISGIKVTQFGVNCNTATTGHKLQGTSKDKVIVGSWNYTFPNWTHVVLSRVQTLSGLFLCEKLDVTKPFPGLPEVMFEERRLEDVETEMLAKWEAGQTERESF
eukprot:CAMPEP_0181047948 /NCGR_PEP_ID=MMETSP1070-20121207/15159_1 /TAXON_ID=265543 /ORGANISM="Minutocellus polymorphus, Strain NH13" /LENGTH=189 /DNA_ID=CAMNT_0023126669 /DNA_START=2011 /DNA_END=2577 /DNA_ORIENTATION=-